MLIGHALLKRRIPLHMETKDMGVCTTVEVADKLPAVAEKQFILWQCGIADIAHHRQDSLPPAKLADRTLVFAIVAPGRCQQ